MRMDILTILLMKGFKIWDVWEVTKRSSELGRCSKCPEYNKCKGIGLHLNKKEKDKNDESNYIE